jgi:predicted nucleotidyltransferase
MGQRPLPDDFKDFIKSLNKNKVKYLLLGGWAVGYYANPRLTKDIDFLIAADDANLGNLKKAFYDFGAPTIDFTIFKNPVNFFRMGRPPLQIDVMSNASGIEIMEAYKRKHTITAEGIKVDLISIEDLIKNKKISGRKQDLADAEKLELYFKKKKHKKCI